MPVVNNRSAVKISSVHRFNFLFLPAWFSYLRSQTVWALYMTCVHDAFYKPVNDAFYKPDYDAFYKQLFAIIKTNDLVQK